MTRIKFVEGFGQGSESFRKFALDIQEEINGDQGILDRVDKCNEDFANRIKEKLDKYKSYKDMGIIVSEIQRNTPRYIYLKHREYNGKKYLIDIDLLERNFSIVEE